MHLRLRRLLVGLVTGLLLVLGLGSVTAPAAQAARTPSIQLTKVTPTSITAQIVCPTDPNPDGTQNFFLSVASPNDESAGYQLDVAALCDGRRHQVRVPYVNGVAPVVGTRVDIFGTISGDSGEINVQYEDWRVQR
jgi:hypothetical protein